MNSNQLKLLFELADELLQSSNSHNQKTALMMYQAGANIQSAEAYVRLYKAKKITNFKNKKYPNTAIQDLFEAVNRNYPDAIVIAAKEKYFADTSVQYFYLKLAEKLQKQNEKSDLTELSTLLEKTVATVPAFMQTYISDYVLRWNPNTFINVPIPICRSCSNLKRWESTHPICLATSFEISEFMESCSLIKKIEIDPSYIDDVKFNMDESYNESSDDD